MTESKTQGAPRCVVTRVEEGGVAGEEGRVEVGDVLTKLMETSLIGVDRYQTKHRISHRNHQEPHYHHQH